MVVLFLIICGTSMLFFIVVSPFFIATKNAQGILHILANLLSFVFLIIAILLSDVASDVR